MNSARMRQLLLAAGWMLAGGVACAQSRPVAGGNPLETLPQVNAPQKTPSVTVQVQPQTPPLERLLATHITPSSFQIEGVKSIPFDEVAKRFLPLVGQDVTIGKLIETADGVTKLYQQRGYALSFAFVPTQTFEHGAVRVTIVEGYVADVTIKGNPGALEGKIRAIAAHIVEDRPLRRATFERYMQVLGLLPGLTVSGDVAPPTNTNGATTLVLTAQHKTFNVSSGLDVNHPGVQGLLTATENGLTSLGEQLSVSALLPRGPDHTTYVGAHGALPIGSNGLTAKIDATHFRSNPTDTPGLPSYVERTVISDKLSASMSYPIAIDNTHSLIGTVSAYATHDYNGYQNTQTGLQYGLASRVRVLQLQTDYAQVQTGEVRKASFSIAKGFNLLGASKSVETNVPGLVVADPTSLTFFRTDASVSQSNDWPLGIGTAIAATGQYSPDSLPTSEQISFGAQRFAQGYQPGETAGDSGWALSLEVNRSVKIGWRWLQTLTPYVSYDMARVYLHAGPAEPSRLASVSVGFRLSDSKYYSLDLSVARALADAPIENPSRNPRINATFSYQLN